MKWLAAIIVFAGVAHANLPPPSFCELEPDRCPALTKLERAKFAKLDRTLTRLLPTKKPYKRFFNSYAPARVGYGRRGSAFPQEWWIQVTYFTDPKDYASQGHISIWPLSVPAYHSAGGKVVADRDGWLVFQYPSGNPNLPNLIRYEIIVGERAGEGIPHRYPPKDAPDPPGKLRSLHISVSGSPGLATELRDALDEKTLTSLVEGRTTP